MKPRRKSKSRKYVFRIVLVLGVLVYALYHYVNQQMVLSELKEKRAANDARIQVLQADIETLERELAQSESLEFVERVARDEMGMVRPREVIYSDEHEDGALDETEEQIEEQR